jgi:hypothetical protein
LACGLVAAWLACGTAFAEKIVLQPSAPEQYLVAKGDTLWDISEKFLRDPWLWPEIWQVNPSIANPHLIYPGDVISLSYDQNGRPILSLQRGSAGPTVKLSPQARVVTTDAAIPAIPLDAIQQFLTRAGVISQEEYDKLPYVVGFQEERLIAGPGDTAYVRGMTDAPHGDLAIIRIGQAYRNQGANDRDVLGYEVIEAGTAKFIHGGDPTSTLVTHAFRELLRGDRVAPATSEPVTHFMPHSAPPQLEGQIIAVLEGVSRIGQHHVVVLNVGQKQGAEIGHVFAVYQAGRTVQDTFTKQRGGESVTLPDIRAGVVMVFRTFDKVSYALVTRAEREMRLYDNVKAP